MTASCLRCCDTRSGGRARRQECFTANSATLFAEIESRAQRISSFPVVFTRLAAEDLYDDDE